MSLDEQIVHLAESLGRQRALTEPESRMLERALWRIDGYNREQAKSWKQDEGKLRRMLAQGMRPAQIAVRLKRTPRAIYRKMYKLGLTCGKGSVVSLEKVA